MHKSQAPQPEHYLKIAFMHMEIKEGCKYTLTRPIVSPYARLSKGAIVKIIKIAKQPPSFTEVTFRYDGCMQDETFLFGRDSRNSMELSKYLDGAE